MGHSQERVLKWKQRILWDWYATATKITKTAQRMGGSRGRPHVYLVSRAVPEKSTSQYFAPETAGMPCISFPLREVDRSLPETTEAVPKKHLSANGIQKELGERDLPTGPMKLEVRG